MLPNWALGKAFDISVTSIAKIVSAMGLSAAWGGGGAATFSIEEQSAMPWVDVAYHWLQGPTVLGERKLWTHSQSLYSKDSCTI